MNFEKINKLILKKHYSKKENLMIGTYQDKIAIIDNGIRIFIIPKDEMILSVDKLNAQNKNVIVENIIGDIDLYQYATLSNEMKISSDEKRIIRKIHNDKYECYVDEKLLKDFEGAVYKIRNVNKRMNLVLAYYENKIVGVIFPIAYNV